MYEIDLVVEKIRGNPDSEAYESFIKEHTSYVLAIVSGKLGRYIQIENDEAFAVGLSAFVEAIEKYDHLKGHFLSFARLVIERRVSNWRSSHHHDPVVSIDGIIRADEAPSLEDQLMLREEIRNFEQELALFGISFDDLIDDGPKHVDTRQRAQEIAQAISQQPELVAHLYSRKRLPFTKIGKQLKVTRKVLYGSQNYIISLVIIYVKEFNLLKNWI